MEKLINFVELNYYCHSEVKDPELVIEKHLPSNLYLEEWKKYASIALVKHLDYRGEFQKKSIKYYFLKRGNNFWQLPFTTHGTVKKNNPDVVVVQGLIFPLQVIFLRIKLGRKPIILLQHHSEVPYKKKRIFQKLADRCVNGYLFTSLANVDEWCKAGIIKNINRCFEMPPATTLFSRKDKTESTRQTKMRGSMNFLWVGRFNENKDPLTVLAAFEKFFSINPDAALYMIYQENDLLSAVQQKISDTVLLKEKVVLLGKLPHNELETWYSAADYFISASYREGGSYVLMEAMSCGCVPIVSNIPASMKMIDNGKVGFYFEAGDPESLYQLLLSLNNEDYKKRSIAAENHFKKEMSSVAIANKMYGICKILISK
jgi:glycosyltransferase involved in cell wall biosynthesis